LKEKQVTYK